MSVVFLLAWVCGLIPTLSWATIVLKIIKSLWETFRLAVLSLGLSYISMIIIRPSSTFTHEDSRTVRCSHLHSKPSFAVTGILKENVLTHDCKWQKASRRHVNSYPLSLFFQMSNTNVHTHFWLYFMFITESLAQTTKELSFPSCASVCKICKYYIVLSSLYGTA